MNPILQRWVDELLETSAQQWVLRVVAVTAAVAALLAALAAGGRWWLAGLVMVTVLSIAAAVRPDTHIALTVVVVIVWRWLVTVDRLGSAWLPVAAVCLLVFHAVTSLTATVPTGGRLPSATLWRWCRRVAVVATATVSMWVLVVVFDRRDAPGNAFLTGAAFAIVAIGAVAIRLRSLESSTSILDDA